jgi:uncharacterized membrane protein (DUF2068 family)
MPTEKPKRPFGVTVIVILTVLSIIFNISTLLAIPNLPVIERLEIFTNFTQSDVINILLIPLQLILAFGLWYLKRWAWVLYMLQLGISMINGLQAHFRGLADVDYLVMAINVLVVFYLNQRDVQRAFGYVLPTEEFYDS